MVASLSADSRHLCSECSHAHTCVHITNICTHNKHMHAHMLHTHAHSLFSEADFCLVARAPFACSPPGPCKSQPDPVSPCRPQGDTRAGGCHLRVLQCFASEDNSSTALHLASPSPCSSVPFPGHRVLEKLIEILVFLPSSLLPCPMSPPSGCLVTPC